MQTIQQKPDRLTEEFQQGVYDDLQALKSASQSGARQAHSSFNQTLSRAWSPVKAFIAGLMPLLLIAFTFSLTLLAEVTAAVLALMAGVYGLCLIVIGYAASIQAFGTVLEFLHIV